MRPFVIVGGTSVPTGRTGKASGLKSLPQVYRIILTGSSSTRTLPWRWCAREAVADGVVMVCAVFESGGCGYIGAHET
jgi:hypothetical protein